VSNRALQVAPAPAAQRPTTTTTGSVSASWQVFDTPPLATSLSSAARSGRSSSSR
jgi:hypothetical protein